MVQTVLASFKLRALGSNPMQRSSRRVVLKTDGGARLLGALSPRPERPANGLVILIHGWEGSIDSTYILTLGRRLYRSGFDVFRLNLRDHGASHHLNRGLFFATLIDEVFQAVGQVAQRFSEGPVFLTGFSLGGNFALRIARLCRKAPVANLHHVVSVSPVLDPDRATDRIDSHPLLLRYFLKKWSRSLDCKRRLFPDIYGDISSLTFRSVRQVTDCLMPVYSDFTDSRTYFNAYALKGNALAEINVPTTIITAADDPIIPVDDFHNLRLSPATRLIVHARGGHQGFVETVSMQCWHERKIAALFLEAIQ